MYESDLNDMLPVSSSMSERECGGMRVMFANSMLAYRDVLSTVFRSLRPHFDVCTVEPDDLDRECKRISPDIVVCSRATDFVRRNVVVCIELHPEDRAESFVNLCNVTTEYADMDLDTLISIMDEAENRL